MASISRFLISSNCDFFSTLHSLQQLHILRNGIGVIKELATGTAFVISAKGCISVKLTINIAMPVFCMPVSIAIVKQSFDDCLHIFAIIQPITLPSLKIRTPNVKIHIGIIPKAAKLLIAVMATERFRLPSKRTLLSNSSESNVGLGRIFSTNLILEEAIAAVQKHIGLDVHVALGNQHTLKSKIITVAVCAGSGSSLLRGIKADLYITGEMSHHELIEANQNNISVILCNHSNSERGFLKSFKMKLEAILKNDCEVIISDKDADPLVTFPKTELKSQIEIS
uniref:NIF3-like protein 1 n=1 Tax=Glossina brevipalpis TaxID=37001 RepID=A0A1A9X1H5_9MUSC